MPAFRGNLSAWARASGLRASTLAAVRESGVAKPETLVMMAKGARRSPKEVFIAAGWLDPDPETLSPEAGEAAELVESIPEDLRVVALEGLRATARSLTEPTFQQSARSYLRAAERPESRYTASP